MVRSASRCSRARRTTFELPPHRSYCVQSAAKRLPATNAQLALEAWHSKQQQPDCTIRQQAACKSSEQRAHSLQHSTFSRSSYPVSTPSSVLHSKKGNLICSRPWRISSQQRSQVLAFLLSQLLILPVVYACMHDHSSRLLPVTLLPCSGSLASSCRRSLLHRSNPTQDLTC